MISNIKDLYYHRFQKNEVDEKVKIWKVLCRSYFQNFIDKNSTVMDLGAGYCEFINNINAKQKIAIDLNPDIKKFANKSVKVYICSSTNLPSSLTGKVDNVFVSNFFEHLSSKNDIVATLNQVKRVLNTKGKIIILLPNIRYVGGKYWDFLDHQLPLSEKSLVEALELSGFKIITVKPKFLPYSTKSNFPKFQWIIELYLKMDFLHLLFGKQSLIIAKKH